MVLQGFAFKLPFEMLDHHHQIPSKWSLPLEDSFAYIHTLSFSPQCAGARAPLSPHSLNCPSLLEFPGGVGRKSIERHGPNGRSTAVRLHPGFGNLRRIWSWRRWWWSRRGENVYVLKTKCPGNFNPETRMKPFALSLCSCFSLLVC